MPKFISIKASDGLTEREAEYLKAIFNLELMSKKGVVGSLEVANFMGVSCATASEVLKKLYEKGLLNREPWRGVSFSEKGMMEVNRILRNHRIFETYAYRFLSISLEDACECANRIELQISDKIIDSMCRILGHPEKCLHNNDIPRRISCCLRK
ncbi:metal-dependent transcriptional regulator [Candidatus Bathyarchaeota archaeon]|nr:metal-dependent transcriptional regulator [Candidatus Bathyarchaeota archaeon]MBS7627757.1 metal-dependent transcriptional regulator [Candidatus Bathyarchaeota archaeon]